MIISDFIFDNSRTYDNSFCRVRVCVNDTHQICVVLTDIGSHIVSVSVTNRIEDIFNKLVADGLIPDNTEIFEHYEDTGYESFRRFSLLDIGPDWKHSDKMHFGEKYQVDVDTFFMRTADNGRLMSQIAVMGRKRDPFMYFPYSPSPKEIARQFEIEQNMIRKSVLMDLVEKNAGEQELQRVIKADLSIIAEGYAHPPDEYICFSEFPVGDGKVDFAVFSGRSRMNVTLIEVKGADFPFLANRGGYPTFASKIDIAKDQIIKKNGYIYRNYDAIRRQLHKIRIKVEKGKRVHNSFLCPKGALSVDPEKDVNFYYVVIGGRTVDDLEESGKRHEYENMVHPPVRLETWDSWLRKLSRE